MFLHKSPIGSHGNLTSRSVVIDNKWVCKVTDYGLTKFRSHSNGPVRKNSEEGLLVALKTLLVIVNVMICFV